ncbi:MAG: ribonuclease PH [Deltaproteobacteria bacterium]|nr:ribonuclease PH [Deltaproteobacteria bacterium]
MTRSDGRKTDWLRPVTIKKDYLKFAEGSVLIEVGNTKVITSVTVEERVPPFLQGKRTGWITAEYSMLPRSVQKRIPRESSLRGGRTHEIQRLIGRSLRAVVDMTILGERTITVDCDVIQADGGTRCASITGAYVALADTINWLVDTGAVDKSPLMDSVAATSVGIVGGERLLDLAYEEDSTAEVDMNVVMTGGGKIVEVQGTAESSPFTKKEMDSLFMLAKKGIRELTLIQKKSLEKRR